MFKRPFSHLASFSVDLQRVWFLSAIQRCKVRNGEPFSFGSCDGLKGGAVNYRPVHLGLKCGTLSTRGLALKHPALSLPGMLSLHISKPGAD